MKDNMHTASIILVSSHSILHSVTRGLAESPAQGELRLKSVPGIMQGCTGRTKLVARLPDPVEWGGECRGRLRLCSFSSGMGSSM